VDKVSLTPGFWHHRLEVNGAKAIFHQWQELEKSGCLENFRVAAGQREGTHHGWFFADSDAHKWLDAAARIYRTRKDPALKELMDRYAALVRAAQDPDGYLYTWNQILFPGTRWINLQIEHELYCHGHLIEAGVSHHQATGETAMLEAARAAADRIVEDFRLRGSEGTPGHQEIEMALLKLYGVTGHDPYRDQAARFLKNRGRMWFFGFRIARQFAGSGLRGGAAERQRRSYRDAHPGEPVPDLPPGNAAKKPWNTTLRWYAGAFSGRYFQQHAPVRDQHTPEGHAVRFAYMETAAARLIRETGGVGGPGNAGLARALVRAWDRMVTRRMYVTGGIGSLPGSEGFGRDYELDPEIAYAETCAALGCIFWNREMAELTGEAKYSDLTERQLYNAAAVGMGLKGDSYFYNNPLTCRGGVTRRPWFAIPCCPSNISRTWADLGGYLHSEEAEGIRIHQYISARIDTGPAVVEMESALPWEGLVSLILHPSGGTQDFSLFLRRPSWSPGLRVRVNGEPLNPGPAPAHRITGSGFDPAAADWIEIRRPWREGDKVELVLDMEIRLLRPHPKVKGHKGRGAVCRGPLVYCLETCDNPGEDIFRVNLEGESLQPVWDPELLGGCIRLEGLSREGRKLTLIPYFLWGNRGPSGMTVWVGTT
jgi:hypothetical protein